MSAWDMPRLQVAGVPDERRIRHVLELEPWLAATDK